MKGNRLNYDKTELATCYNFVTSTTTGKLNKKITLVDMNSRGWSIGLVTQAILDGSGKDVVLTPRLTEHGVGYYDIEFAE